MPVFHIKVTLSNGKSFSEFRDVPDTDLDTYYLEIKKMAQHAFGIGIADLNVTQLSSYSRVVESMRSRGEKRLVQRSGK